MPAIWRTIMTPRPRRQPRPDPALEPEDPFEGFREPGESDESVLARANRRFRGTLVWEYASGQHYADPAALERRIDEAFAPGGDIDALIDSLMDADPYRFPPERREYYKLPYGPSDH
jgi:hypothetical protein